MVIVWKHYLVLAMALDVVKKVDKHVKALVPAEEIPSPFRIPTGAASLRFLDGFSWVHVSAADRSSRQRLESGRSPSPDPTIRCRFPMTRWDRARFHDRYLSAELSRLNKWMWTGPLR